MAATSPRVAGSGFTTMLWNGTRLAYLQVMQETPPSPVATAQAIQPIDEPIPLEIVTSMAVGVGTIRCTFYELWNEPVWSSLPGLNNTINLLEVLKAQVSMGAVTMQKVIKAPNGILRSKVFHNVVITDIDEGENVNIGTMTLPKTLTFQYCHSTAV
jgi:hypothetical protein